MQTVTNDNATTVIPKDNLQSAANNNTTKGILTRVYKFFMVSFGKDRTPVWNKLMESYINDPVNNIPQNRNKQTSAKGNMKREYLSSQLSWPKFCEAMRFAKFKKLEIIFIAEDENGQRMKMHEELNFDTIDESDFADDLLTARVSDVTNDAVYRNVNETDARVKANAPSNLNGGIPRMKKDFEWIDRPDNAIQEIINDSIVK